MRYIELTYNSDARTLTISDSLAGTTVDDLSTSFRLDSATLSRDADIDIVYGVLLRSRSRTSVGYSFSRFDRGEDTVSIPQDVLKACKGGSLPIYLRITYDADGSIETSLPLTLRVANLPDPVEAVHASGDLVMLRMSSWDWRKGLTYAKGAVVTNDRTLYVSLNDTNRGIEPGVDEGWEDWWGTVSTSSGLPPGIAPYLENLSENVQDAIDRFRDDIHVLGVNLEDVENDVIDLKDATDGIAGQVDAVRTDLAGKQNLILMTEPVNPVAGDIWIEDKGPIDPTVIDYASSADLRMMWSRVDGIVSDEARQRADGDNRALNEARAMDSAVLEEAKAYAERVGSAAYRYKGSVSNADLTMVRDPSVGDLYNITDNGRFPAGSNVVWDGSDWDKLSETIDLSRYDNHILDNANPHHTHYSQIGLSEAQMSAINSGISAQKVGEMEEAVASVESMISFGPSAPSSAKLWIYYE